MKRLKISIIFVLLLSLIFPMSVYAAAGDDYPDAIPGVNYDPRTDARYSSYFDYSNEDVSELNCHGDLVIQYKYVEGSNIYLLKSYLRFYLSDERFGVVLDVTVNPEHCYWLLKSGTKYMVSSAAETTHGTFNCYKNGSTSYYNSNAQILHSHNVYDIEVLESEIPVFSSQTDLDYYLNTGIIRNALYDPTIYYSGDDLYFTEFKVIPHVSSDYDKFYFEICYELSDFAKANVDNLNLRFDNQYTLDIEGFAAVINEQGSHDVVSNSFSLAKYPKGFKLYLGDIASIQTFVSEYGIKAKKQILGKEFFFDTSYISVGGLGGETFVKIVGSNLYCQFYLRAYIDGTVYQGKRNDFNYDFLKKSYSADVWIPTEDSSIGGNFDYIKDGDTITSSEYYFNEVTTNNNGDTVNNYYYYDSNGNRKEITEDVYTNSSASASIGDINISVGDGSGEYIGISPVDYNQFVEAVVAALKEFDTKGGVFKLLQGAFSLFPDRVNKIMSGAIAAVVLVSLFCILRRR